MTRFPVKLMSLTVFLFIIFLREEMDVCFFRLRRSPFHIKNGLRPDKSSARCRKTFCPMQSYVGQNNIEYV
jgi:hypothetical protein